MIFATVGTQLPFDRLILALDQWAASNSDQEVFAQIGRGEYQPEHVAWTREMDPGQFRQRMAQCDTVVAHAGMGSIISAMEMGKQVIIMPRRASLGEHRNEHQLATAKRLEHLNGLQVVQEAEALADALAVKQDQLQDIASRQPHPQLIAAIRNFAGLRVA